MSTFRRRSLRCLAIAVGICLVLIEDSHGARGQEDERKISLVQGQQKVIRVPGLAKVAIGDPNVADVKPVGGNQLLVTGLAAGRTTLLVWKTSGEQVSYTVHVTAQDPHSVVGEIQSLLGDREGISVRVVGDSVYLDGFAFTADDYERVKQITQIYANVKSFVKLNPNAKQLLAQQLTNTLHEAGLKDVTANVVGATIFLEGSVESQQDLQKAELIIKAVGETVENLVAVGIKRMILTEVDFVEIKRGSYDHIGLKMPLDWSGEVFLGQPGSSLDWNEGIPKLIVGTGRTKPKELLFTITGNTTWRIGMQFNDGYARILSRPKLVCASGEKAEFLAGGEVPIPLITEQSVMVEYKKFGVMLGINPTADRQGNIQTLIEAEVSDVDDSLSIKIGGMELPGFSVDRVKTNVTVKHGETIVLSGLFNNIQQKDVSKFPLLGHIPIIGELFKSRNFRERKSELVIFVTPRIVNPASEKIIRTIQEIKDRYQKAQDEVGFSLFD